MGEKIKFLNTMIDNLTMDEALDEIKKLAAGKKRTTW